MFETDLNFFLNGEDLDSVNKINPRGSKNTTGYDLLVP